MKQLMTLILLLITCSFAELEITADISSTIGNPGDTLLYEVRVNTRDSWNGSVPTIPKAPFYTLAGEVTKSSNSKMSIQVRDGKRSTTRNYEITYFYKIVCHDREGVWSIGPARVKRNGKSYTSDAIPIRIGDGLSPVEPIEFTFIKSSEILEVGVPFELTLRTVMPRKSHVEFTKQSFNNIYYPLQRKLMNKNVIVEPLTYEYETTLDTVNNMPLRVTNLSLKLTPKSIGKTIIKPYAIVYSKKKTASLAESVFNTSIAMADSVMVPELVLNVVPKGGKKIASVSTPKVSTDIQTSLIIAVAGMALLLVLFFIIGFMKAKQS